MVHGTVEGDHAVLQAISISVNGSECTGVRMKLGHAGEAYFVQVVPLTRVITLVITVLRSAGSCFGQF